jgi:hypothetical protein
VSASSAPTHLSAGPNPLESRRGLKWLIRILAIIIGVSVILSFRWWSSPPGFRDDAFIIIGFTVIMSGLVFLVYFVMLLVTSLAGGWPRQRFCPRCGRQIPFDALVCPYCGNALP